MKKFLKIWFLAIISLVSYGSIFHGLPGWDIFSIDQTFAQDSTEKMFSNLASMLQLVLRLVYVLIWPLLVIAGQSMDNTFVYGSIFQLDAPLWKMRNLMKNFANFFLGFFMLYQILKFVFWQNKEADIKKVITSTLIAWVAIQASWFFLAALIDLSTIATYAIGSLPVTVLENTKLWEKPLLSEDADINLKDIGSDKSGNSDFRVEKRYGIGDKSKKITKCFLSWGNIVGVIIGTGSKKLFWSDYKAFAENNKDVYHINMCYISNNDVVYIDNRESIPYIETKDQIKEKQKWRESLLQIWWLTLGNLMKASKSYVGPMVVLYSSLLDFSSMNVVNLNNDLAGLSVEFIIKLIATLALVIPIVLMAVVLIIRVGALWLVIAFSPLIALKWSFGNDVSILGMDKKMEPNFILSLIFAPVIAVFALSISIIFLSIIQESMLTTNSAWKPNIERQLGIEIIRPAGWDQVCLRTDVSQNEFCMKLKEQEVWWSMYLDYFNWVVLNLFAIGLMWTLFFAVMKSIDLTSGFVWSIEEMWKSVAMSTPILPVPGIWAISAAGAQNAVSEVTKNYTQGNANADDLVKNLALRSVGAWDLTEANKATYFESKIRNGEYQWDFLNDIREIYKKEFDSLGIVDQKEVYDILKNIWVKLKKIPEEVIKWFEPLIIKMNPKDAKEFIESHQTIANAWYALSENRSKQELSFNYEEWNTTVNKKVPIKENANKNLEIVLA